MALYFFLFNDPITTLSDVVLQADFSTEQFEEASLTKLAKVASFPVVCDLNFPLTLPVFLDALGTKST